MLWKTRTPSRTGEYICSDGITTFTDWYDEYKGWSGARAITHWMDMPPLPGIPSSALGIVLGCAVRESISKSGGVPLCVASYIKPMVPDLPTKALWCLKRDINDRAKHKAIGDPPLWMGLLEEINRELLKRGKYE